MDKCLVVSLQFKDDELAIIILLVSFQIITGFSNIIVIIVIKRCHTRDAMSACKRTIILLTTIAIPGIILIADFDLAVYLIIPLVKLSALSPIVSLVIGSIVNYLIVLSLYLKSFTMALLSIDQYYSLTRIFDKNPLDKISTNLLVKITWLACLVLSLFFLFNNYVYFYEWRTRSLVCYYYENYSMNKIFIIINGLTMIIFQYIVPALIIFVFSFRTIIYFLKKYFQKNETGFEYIDSL